MEFITMVIQPENEVPSEVRHQTDVAGDAVFQSDPDLTEQSDVMIINWIGCPKFTLSVNASERGIGWCAGYWICEGGIRMLLVEILVGRGATINETNTAC